MTLTLPPQPARMPTQHPHIAHFMPYLIGDSLRAILMAFKLGFRYIDQNGQADAHGIVWIMHWARVILNGYRWYWTGHHHADGTEVRRRVPWSWKIDHLSTTEVSHLRSRKRGGRRPHTARVHMAHCKAKGRILCLEGKGTLHRPVSFTYVASSAISTGCVVIFMTLQSIPGWRTRLRNAHAVGLPLAILPRGRKPDDWHEFEAMGVQVWGRWRP